MQVTAPLVRSLADEHVIGIDPPLKPDLPGVWRRRINAFTGRAISDKALTAEQDMRAGLQRLHGLGMTAGIIDGLELTTDGASIGRLPDAASIGLSPGLALAQSGEDIGLGSSRQMRLGALPVVLPVALADSLNEAEPGDTPTVMPLPPRVGAARDGEAMATRLLPEAPRTIALPLGRMIAAPGVDAVPRVGIIVAQPIGATILGRTDDDCPPDPRDDPYADLQRVDGARLLLYMWPSEMVARVDGADYSLPPGGPGLRNALAYRIFDMERGFLRGEAHPWEAWGVPLALVGFANDWTLAFVDRAAVVRRGGAPRPRTALVPQTGTPALGQARVDQFVEHLGGLPDLSAPTLRAAFGRVPPAGVLPASCYDIVTRRQSFFPGGFGISAVPIPRSDLDLALREAAALEPYNLSAPDCVELLLPVPDHAYEPGLLQTAVPDARFAEAIAGFEADRGRWIVRREQVRRRYDRLMEGVSGLAVGWATASLSETELAPPPALAAPLHAARTRRFAAGAAVRTHAVETNATLTIAAGDTVWLWVRVHDAAGLTGVSLRLAGPASAVAGPVYADGVYWGAPDALDIAAITNSGLAARRVGDLPLPSVWQRLSVPADRAWSVAGKGIAGASFAGVEFAQRGGDIEYGPFGKDDASGNSVVWIADEAPGAATFKVGGSAAAWPWTAIADRTLADLPDYGTQRENDARIVVATKTFADDWKQPFLAADIAKLGEIGFDAYLDRVDARLKATNDAIDLGFVRARSDIYRVRQFMLGGDAASRLVTSPSLADLAIRDEGARATNEGISKFIKDAVIRKPEGITFLTKAVAQTAPAAPPPVSSGFSNAAVNNVFATMHFVNFNAPAATVTAKPAASAPAAMASFVPPNSFATFAAAPVVQTAKVAPLNFARFADFAIPASAAQLSFGTRDYVPNDVRAQRPIAGLIERTISVAERLTPAPAVQALEYAIASKQAVLQTLRGLRSGADGRPVGVAIDDLVVPGFALKAAGTPAPTVALLFADLAKGEADRAYVDLDVMIEPRRSDASTPPSDKHESDYFTAAVNAIDNAIAMMRLVEGRVSLFEQLAASARDVRASLLADAGAAGAALRAIDVEIEEARHDLATAQTLFAEEAGRVEALMARRNATLANLTMIGYRRVREADCRSPAPTQQMLSALAETPVAACRREHPDTPTEIRDYVALLRDAPVAWFPAIAAAVARIDRIESALAAIRFSRDRALVMQQRPAFFAIDAQPKFLMSAVQATHAQAGVFAARALPVARIDLGAMARLSLLQLQQEVRGAATLGDLAQGDHRSTDLARMANAEIAGLGEIAACLHAEFAEVPPILRLRWAELLSEFDRPADLHLLGGLPGWQDASRESRRSLQGLVDWLFARIDRDDRHAAAMMNELVRIALLLAAHAPVKKLIPGRLLTEAPARIGSLLHLSLDIMAVRPGMIATIKGLQNQIVSRAIIDDIADGRASARIVEVAAGVTTIAPAMRIELSTLPLRIGR